MIDAMDKSSASVTATNELFRALADPSRRRILHILAAEELPLNRITAQFNISRPAVIKHLRVLRSCRLVKIRRHGRQTFHRLDSRPLRIVKNWVAQFDKMWDEHLMSLKRQAEAKS